MGKKDTTHDRDEWRTQQKEVKELHKSRIYKTPKRAKVEKESHEKSQERNDNRKRNLANQEEKRKKRLEELKNGLI